ncbi:DEAD/DEAH box helicase [Saccharopolyspora taberi]|uniref:DEAD/DEAH box helicase n=1 Tax=Saccharopolyspora taberi TaxID=60895 RepID=A0ABN3VJS9_9PSEU
MSLPESLQATFVPESGAVAFWGRADPAGLGLPPGAATTLATALPSGDGVADADVPATAVPLGEALGVLAAFPSPDRWPGWQRPGDSVLAWSVAAKLALEQVCAGMLVPVHDGSRLRWRLARSRDGRWNALAESFPPAGHALRRDGGIWSAPDLLAAFADSVADLCARGGDGPESELDPDALAEWASPLLDSGTPMGGRLCLRLGVPDRDGQAWPLTFHLQVADAPEVSVPAERAWAAGSATLQLPGGALADPQDSLVRGLAHAAEVFPPVDAALSQRSPTGMDLDTDQAAALLADGVPALRRAGIAVEVPDVGVRRVRARLRADGDTFRWEAALGDSALEPGELDEIIALGRPLARWRGEWIRADARELRRVRDLLGRTGELTGPEALAVVLEGHRSTGELGEVEVSAEGRLRELVDRLAPGSAQPRLDGIDATLRHYQERGVAWLQLMADLGLGAVLADDMGLGKTLQTIALLAGRGGDRPHLVVCPTSVVGNWQRELARFAPDLPVHGYHGPGRRPVFEPGSVVVTSYALLRLDADRLAGTEWDVVVLDEAQQIKNQAGLTARSAARLRARARVALTGTPVENRLSELWSIMNFANPALLGPFARFKERFAIPIERWRDPEATARLRAVVAPFLLRRLKDEVATDLPEKVESVVSCALTGEQARLYRRTVERALDSGLGDGIARRGRVLKLLTELKQICNHPAQFLREPGPLPERSGKLARATEMLAEVVAAGDRALVFTQYRVMGELLARHLAEELGLGRVPFLHGGVDAAGRRRLVDEFQTSDRAAPLLVVSLKAGGTGLNLTRATHVLHYDRWWNPAVEDQATDRAHRIGQTRAVLVHKLVTHGTLEERITDLLERKRELADAVVGSGESWLTELDDDALRALVELADEEA